MSKWKEFEQLVYQLQQQLSGDAEVVLDASLPGDDSKTDRQIDILVKRSIGQYPIVIAMECKDYKRPVDVKEVEAFATKLKDIKANKGAMVAGKGFSQAALETAKRHGIDMFRFVDTQSTNWKVYASIPASVEQIFFQAMQFHFSDFVEIPIVFINPPHEANIFSPEKELLGILKDIMIKKWINNEIPKTSGVHFVEIVTNGFVGTPEHLCSVTIRGLAHVERKVFFGPLPVDFVGLKNEHGGGVLTRSFTTEMLDTAQLTEGKLAGWSEIDPSQAAVQPLLTFVVERGPSLGSVQDQD
ncbi:MAG: restriction endonuclease [Patescibacteria group bacterium]